MNSKGSGIVKVPLFFLKPSGESKSAQPYKLHKP
jgi:hypothetical protein